MPWVADDFQQAFALAIKTKSVLVGPVAFLKLGKVHGKEFNRYSLLTSLIDVYTQVLRRLVSAEAEWIQFDKPAFALDLTAEEQTLLQQAYSSLSQAAPELKLMVTTYFNDLGVNLDTFVQLPVHGLHVVVTKSVKEVGNLITQLDSKKILSLGVVDGPARASPPSRTSHNYHWLIPTDGDGPGHPPGQPSGKGNRRRDLGNICSVIRCTFCNYINIKVITMRVFGEPSDAQFSVKRERSTASGYLTRRCCLEAGTEKPVMSC